MNKSMELTAEMERGVNRLRNSNLDKFLSMCKMHLSFLLDLSGSSFEEFLTDNEDEELQLTSSKLKSKPFTPFNNKKKSKNAGGDQNVPSLSQDCIDQVYQLVQYLGRPNNINQEGLFRKTGQLQRQKQLKRQLYCGKPLDLEGGNYSAHDCANVLKQFLGDLPEPLLGDRYYKGHCQVAEMLPTEFFTEKDKKRIFNKQIKSIQLLFHLLPSEHSTVLECLLKLLHKVSKVEDNKMTADTLGTLFAPHILCPRKITAVELRAVSKSITKAVAFMIENGPQLFKIPFELARDISTYWKEMEQAPDSRPSSRASMTSSSSSDEDPDLTNERFGLRHESSMATNTCITFVDREATKAASAATDTETALAQLYAHVQSMPDSSKKRKLLKQFNHMNGGVATPLDTTECNNKSVSKHKRTKSIGNSLKKHFMRGRKNRTSNCENNTFNLSEDGILSSQFDSSICNKENEFSLCLTPCHHIRTPVKKLFTDAYKTPRSQVCIVDMNDTLSPLINTPDSKRKRRSYSLGNDGINLSAILSPVAEKALKASSLSKVMVNPRCRAPLSIFRSPAHTDVDFLSSPAKKQKTTGCYV